MRRLQSSLVLKVVAFVLLVVTVLAGIGSGLMLAYGYDQGVYGTRVWYEDGERKESDGTFYSTYNCESLAHEFAWQVADSFQNGWDVEKLYSDGYYSCDFTLRQNDANGKVLASTIRADENYGAHYSDQHSIDGKVTYYIEVAVTKPLRGADGFYYANKFFDQVVRLRPALIPILVSAIVLFLICLIYLLCAAGYRKGSETAVLNGLDRIPLDLYAAILAAGVLFCLYITVDYAYDALVQIVLVGLSILVTTILSMALLMSFATRVKVGQWWRNTVIYRLWRWLLRCAVRLWKASGNAAHALPLIGRTAFAVPVVIIVDICLVFAAQWNGFWFLIALLYNVAIVLGLCFGALQMRRLQKAGAELAGGNFEYKVETDKMYWDFKRHGENLNAIGDGMAIAVEQRMRSERLKTELITNVSHDIKTPLTSIVNYVDLLLKEHSEEDEAQYLEVLRRQAARLKKLTEDLVEASKASTGNVSANLIRTNAVEIINQALGEYQTRMAAGQLTVVTDLPDEEVPVLADGRLLWRVLDNLLSNVCKYALAGTRVYVSVQRGGETVIAVKNISRQPLNVSAEELMERFVRGDTARSTEGSGLGLNIAKSLTELQGGTFSLYIDGDFFRAEVRLKSM